MSLASPEAQVPQEKSKTVTEQAEQIKDAVRAVLDAPKILEVVVNNSDRKALVQAAEEVMELCYIAQSEHGLDGTVDAARAELERDAILALLAPEELEQAIENHRLWCSGYGNHRL